MATQTAPLTPGLWKVDLAGTAASFTAKSFFGLVPVKGTIPVVEASVHSQETETQVRATLDLSGVDTKNAKRDTHLKSADFFDVQASPHAEFTGSEVSLSGETWTLRGTLTIGQVSGPVVLTGTMTDQADGSRRVSAEGTVNRTDFGLTKMAGMIPATVRIAVTAVLTPA